MWQLRSLLICALSLASIAGHARSAILTWPGPAPCGTGLQACINAAAPGDMVLVATNNPINEDLTIDKSLTLKAQTGFTPRLGALHFIFLSNPNPSNNVIVLEDFRCDRARIFGVQISTGSFNVSMRRLNIENTYNDGPAIQIRTGQTPPYGPVVFDVSDNRITIPAGSQFNGAEAISIEGYEAASMTGVLRGNVINHFDGGQQGGIGLYNLHANPFDVDVIGNTIVGADFNYGINLFQFGNGTSQARYLDNLVVGQINVAGAPGAYVVNISDGAATFEIVNNTTADGGIGILIGGRDDLGASWSGTVANNIVSGMTGTGITIDQPTQTSGVVDNDHNLVFDVAFNNFTPGPGTLFVDPQFQGASDYHLSSTSPAVNSGNPARVPADLPTDLDGLPRQVGIVDMGAYESVAPPLCSSNSTLWPACGAPLAVKPGPQVSACLVADGAGGAFLGYVQYGLMLTPPANIWLNHVDTNGNPAPGWPVDGFAVTALSGDRGNPRVAPDGSGGAFVAWWDARNDPGGLFDIYLQHMTSAGSPDPAWPANGLAVHSITPSADEGLLGLVGDGAGGVFVLWSQSSGIRLVRFTASGTIHPSWPVNGIPATPVSTTSTRLIADGAGGVYVCWSQIGQRLTRLTGLGTFSPGWTSAGVAVAAASPSAFVLELGADGGHVNVAWTTSTGEVLASRIRSTGSLAPGWPAAGVLLRSTSDLKSELNVVHGGTSGDVVVIWREDLPTPAGFQTVARRLTPAGAFTPGWPSPVWVVVPDPGGSRTRAFPDCDGGATLSWTGGGGYRALRITSSATVAPGWPSTGVLSCSGPFSIASPNAEWACPDGTGGVITALPAALPGPEFIWDRMEIWGNCVRGDGTVDVAHNGNTPVGSNVSVSVGPVTVSFPIVNELGTTRLDLDDAGPAPPSGLQIVPSSSPVYYELTTTAQFQGPVQVCITYDPGLLQGPETELRLLHYDATMQPPGWVDVTTAIDINLNIICGTSPTLSPFVIVEVDPTNTQAPPKPVLALRQNMPNPFNPTTTIEFSLAEPGVARLQVFDVSGRLVRTLADGVRNAGSHRIDWFGNDAQDKSCASGVYIYRLEAAGKVLTRRMVLLR